MGLCIYPLKKSHQDLLKMIFVLPVYLSIWRSHFFSAGLERESRGFRLITLLWMVRMVWVSTRTHATCIQPLTFNHQPLTISHQPSTINHQPSTTNHQPPTINHQPSTINHQPSTISHQPSTISHQPSTFNHQPSSINHQPSTISHQPSTIISGKITYLLGFA